MADAILPGRPNDITVFGCTGSAGRAVSYHVIRSMTLPLKEPVTQPIQIALAGRNQEKIQSTLTGILEELELTEQEKVGLRERISIVLADASNELSMLELARSSKVVISCAGPFGRYGEAAVKACISGGAHYLDITGEVDWVTHMMTKHNEAASMNRVTLCPFSGYDCLPAELGMVLAGMTLQKTHGVKMKQVNLAFDCKKAGFPKGTLETTLDMNEKKTVVLGTKDVKFYPDEFHHTVQEALAPGTVLKPMWSKHLGVYTAPNFMSPINIPVLCRAASALGFSNDLTITDRSVLSGKSSIWNGFKLFRTLIFTTVLILFNLMLKVSYFRNWLRKKLQTYSFNGNPEGSVIVHAEAMSAKGKRATAKLEVPGDSGIYATGLFATTVALSLHEATREGATLHPLVGFHSPVVALHACRPNIIVDNLRRLGAQVVINEELSSNTDKSKAN